MLWKVIINGKDSGIIESNFKYASDYWKIRERITGKKIKLEKGNFIHGQWVKHY